MLAELFIKYMLDVPMPVAVPPSILGSVGCDTDPMHNMSCENGVTSKMSHLSFEQGALTLASCLKIWFGLVHKASDVQVSLL
jgi:hypothetical protein